MLIQNLFCILYFCFRFRFEVWNIEIFGILKFWVFKVVRTFVITYSDHIDSKVSWSCSTIFVVSDGFDVEACLSGGIFLYTSADHQESCE